MARLKEIYKKEVVPALTAQFGYKSAMQVPRISKIVLNMGVGEAIADKKILDNAVGDLQKISGQKPVITKARKSIAVWKIRTGYPIGYMVTLRQQRMYRSRPPGSIALPRVRDFRGVRAARSTARQFQHGRQEQIISRDRVRQDRRAAGYEYHDRDDGKDRCRQSAARRVQISVQN